jgi:hypothetical protein
MEYHSERKWNRRAAANLIFRIVEDDVESGLE